MKKLLLFIFALFLWTGAWADKTVYLKTESGWEASNAATALRAWVDNGDPNWFDPVSRFKSGSDTYYKFIIGDSYNKIKFSRGSSADNAKSDANKWNFSSEIEPSDNQLFTITGWDNGTATGTTSTYSLNPYSESTKKTIYLRPNIWDTEEIEAYAVYAFNGNYYDWFNLSSPNSDGVYTTQIPTEYTSFILTRLNSAVSVKWDNVWNQTNDITLADVPANANFTIYSWNVGSNKSGYYINNLALLGTATASRAEGGKEANYGNDGNDETRWGSYNSPQDEDWFQLAWDEAQTFNTIKLLCEGAMNAGNAPNLAFDIQTSTDGTNWTPRKHVWGKNAENKNYITVVLNEAATANYVRFQGVKKGNYGYTFYEFEVYNTDYSSETLNSLTISAYTSSVYAKDAVALSAIGKTSADKEIPAGVITWDITGGTGSITNETFTPSEAGTFIIKTTSPSESSTINITVEAEVPAIPAAVNDDNRKGIYSHDLGNTDGYDWASWGGGTGENKKIKGKNAYKISSFNFFGSGFTKFDATSYAKLRLEVYPYFTGTLAIIPIIRNSADTGNETEKGLQFDVTENQWNHLELDFDDLEALGVDMSRLYQIKYADHVDGNNAPVNGDGSHSFIVGNIYLYGTPAVDTDAPIITSAVISNITSTSATLTVRATDDVNRTLSFSVKDGETEIASGSGLPSTDVVISLTGLTPETTYDNLKVYATDQASHTSDAYAIAPFTTMTRTVVKSGNGTITVTQSEQERSINYTYEFILEGDNILTLSFESTNGDPGVEGYSNNNSFMAHENDGMLKDGARSYTWNNAVEGITYGAKCVWPAAGVQCKTPYITYSIPEVLPSPASLVMNSDNVVYNVYCDDSDFQTKGGNNHFNEIQSLQGTGSQADEVTLASGDKAYSIKLATSFVIRYQNGDVAKNDLYYCNIAIYPKGNVTSLTITPLFWDNHGTSFVQTVTPNQWNYISFNEEKYRDAEGGHYALRISGMEGNTVYFDNLFYSQTLPVKIGSHGYTTLISDKALNFDGIDGLTAYSAKREDKTVTLTDVTEVDANKGVVIQGTASQTYYVPILSSTEANVDTDLTGNATDDYSLVAEKYYYVLSNVGGAEGFYHYTGLDNIPAGKAFFETDDELTGGTGANYLSIIFADEENNETNSIKAIENALFMNGAVYNLAGQRVGNDYKGIVIVNGKKYLRK